MIVEDAAEAWVGPFCSDGQTQHFLRAWFSRGSGDRSDARRMRPRRLRPILQSRAEASSTTSRRPRDFTSFRAAHDPAAPRPLATPRSTEFVPVVRVAPQSEKEIARLQRPGVDGHAR